MKPIKSQERLTKELSRVFEIFKHSECLIRPHFILTGPSGSGKTFIIESLAKEFDFGYLEINAAQLTKEGTSGNSLSKALSPLLQCCGQGSKPMICFVDEWDKLFISGNSNSSLAHETTVGVQNEFLKVLESDETSVFGDYGKYISVGTKNILFVFAGAFNGEEDINLDRLRELGIKTEFLGRVGLVFNTTSLCLEDLFHLLETSALLDRYLELFEDVDREEVVLRIKHHLKKSYDNNTLGARLINTLINQYFIKGGFSEDDPNAKSVTFQKKLNL